MKLPVDQLGQRLAAELGADAVKLESRSLTDHCVDGKQPSLVCSPDTPEQIAGALRICAEAAAAVIPWGGGTAMPIGNPPRAVDVVIDTHRLNRIIEHDHANLTATAQCGITVSTLQALLARQNQFLPFDPPYAARATIGGVLAANLNGPRRAYYGSVRDLVIGMKVVLASGAPIKAGGKVVKNVAGYDMCKLLIGSFGTLGIITEATLRMAPLPETTATVAAAGALSEVLQFIDELSRSFLLPAAMVLVNFQGAFDRREDWQVLVRCEGFAETVARHVADAQALARRIGLAIEDMSDSDQRRLWAHIQDFPLQPERLVFRVTVPRAAVAQCARTIEEGGTAEIRPAIMSDALTGTLWVAEPESRLSAQRFAQWLSLAERCRGHAVMHAAPPKVKENIDIWGPPPPAFPLMRALKQQFDPEALLNPGRFVGGL